MTVLIGSYDNFPHPKKQKLKYRNEKATKGQAAFAAETNCEKEEGVSQPTLRNTRNAASL